MVALPVLGPSPVRAPAIDAPLEASNAFLAALHGARSAGRKAIHAVPVALRDEARRPALDVPSRHLEGHDGRASASPGGRVPAIMGVNVRAKLARRHAQLQTRRLLPTARRAPAEVVIEAVGASQAIARAATSARPATGVA